MLPPASAQQNANSRWSVVKVPGVWEKQAKGKFAKHDGFAWYRCFVNVPPHWRGQKLELLVENIDNAHEAFFNGKRIGGAGAFPPKYKNGIEKSQRYFVSPKTQRPGEWNVIAIRVYDDGGHGGFKKRAPILIQEKEAIALEGEWEFRTGDQKSWSLRPDDLEPNRATFSKIGRTENILKGTKLAGKKGGSHSPEDAKKSFEIGKDFRWEQILHEPLISQPLFMNFDERGRLWLVQYLQYPYPAGLKMVSKDRYWRTVYDKVPPPPPRHFRGADKITIHEDTNGDGVFDKHKTFLEGLSIVTSCVKGRGGVWVLNPPYLLFYPDKNNDDIPDCDPEVHLQGFGLEDTHSVANSLRWGPDGWLYAAQGSTVSGNILRPGLDKNPVRSMGQLIWRYHPETRRYEIFAEGGGNAFGVEIDEKGRVFSGHNGGNTRGFHYVQGGYFQKGFSKHGPLSNPYSFGYFRPMKHHKVPRFTHNFILYDGHSFPAKYRGMLFGVEPIQGRVVLSDVQPDGTSFRTKDVSWPVKSHDGRFRPVDIKAGPDGAIYVADFYEPQISHRQHYSGEIDKTTGRVYRLQARDAKSLKPFDLNRKTTRKLIELLKHPNKWYRQTALRMIGDRRDAAVIGLLKDRLRQTSGQLALEYLWALNLSGGLDEKTAIHLLDHDDPYVRLWTVRLSCDDKKVSHRFAERMVVLARGEAYPQVRSQLACSARRLEAKQCLPIVRNLLTHSEDAKDVYIPLLLWWAIESKCEKNRNDVLTMFTEKSLWELPLVKRYILERLMRRFAQAGTRHDLILCSRLLQISSTKEDTELLLKGFERAFQGRSLSGIPVALAREITKAGGGSLNLRLRLGETGAAEEALKRIAQNSMKIEERVGLIRTLGEIKHRKSIPLMMSQLNSTNKDELRIALLTSLQSFSDDKIAAMTLTLYPQFSDDVRAVAESLLVSRKNWAKQFLTAIDSGKIDKNIVPKEFAQRMTVYKDRELQKVVGKLWPNLASSTSAQLQREYHKLTAVLQKGIGDPYRGKKLFKQSCAKCHLLFGDGGRIGPDLTSYKRDDTLRILLNVVNPSAEIREGFETFLAVTQDGRTASGFLFDRDNKVIVLRGVDSQNVTIPRDNLEELIPQKKSLMPEGLLKNLTHQQVRDLFAYLRSSQPLNN